MFFFLSSSSFFFQTDSIRKLVDKSGIKFARCVKLETKNGKSEDRILVSAPKHVLLLDSIKAGALSCSIWCLPPSHFGVLCLDRCKYSNCTRGQNETTVARLPVKRLQV